MKKFGILFLVALIAISCDKAKPIEVDAEQSLKQDSAASTSESPVVVDDNTKPDVYPHIQTLDFEPSGFDVRVLREPLSNDVIYTVQKGDKINISEVLEYRSLKKTYIKVTTPSEDVGYIEITWNPYRDGNYSYLETINVDGSETKILKISETFNVSDGISLKALPSEKAEDTHEVTHAEGAKTYAATGITSDYKWVRIRLGDQVGWVAAKYLSVGRGGPTINYPEAVIEFDLIDSNLI